MTPTRQLKVLLVLLTFLSFTLLFKSQPWFLLSQQKPIDPISILQNDKKSSDTAYFNNQVIPIPQHNVSTPPVLGDSTSFGPKRIEVDLTQQRLFAYEGDHMVYSFLISSGKWDRTPTGTFTIWAKVRSTKMEGGSKELGTYYYLPNVPYVMFYYNDKVAKKVGYSLHGTYWHSNFGIPMSHGCINMKTEEIKELYYWANPNLNGKSSLFSTADNPGTTVTVYGKYQPK